jgi:hypothetical protein
MNSLPDIVTIVGIGLMLAGVAGLLFDRMMRGRASSIDSD